jgi:AbrB family looped-hinge helix DNA binding protein
MARASGQPGDRGDVTTVTSRGQTVVPARLRERLGLHEGSKLRWIEGVGSLVVLPVSDNPIEALAGKYRGSGMLKRLLAERKRDRGRKAR